MLYKIRNLVKSRAGDQGYRLLIRHLDIPQKAKIAITGPSGCGKSTTLDILGLSLKPDSANEFVFSPPLAIPGKWNIQAIWQENDQDALANLRLGHMGYVLQSGELLPFLEAGENMTLTAMLAGMAKDEAEERARGLAALLGIAHLWRSMPATLSVGERQRAAIARALASRPQVILADEPTAALDPLHAARVMEVFIRALEETDSALILVTHNAAWAKSGNLRETPFQLQEDEQGVLAILDNSAALENA